MSSDPTEADISDPERDQMSQWFVCSECGELLQVIDGCENGACLRCVRTLWHGE